MTIIHVVEAFGGGIIDFIHSLSDSTREHNHIIIHSKRSEDVSLRFGRNVEFLNWPHASRRISFKDIKALLALIKILRSLKYDVIHLHSSKAGILGRLASLFIPKGLIIYTPNGVSFDRKDIYFITKAAYIIVEWIIAKMAGTIISVSQSEASLYKNIGVRSFYINNGVRVLDTFKKRSQLAKTQPIRIVTIGRASNQKNPAMFSHIAGKFNDANVEFIWIGEGELRELLDSENITVTGWIKKSQVLELLENSDIYLSTALWEGLPFSVLDAMNRFLPLVLNKCTGNIDLVQKNTNGIIFTTADEAYEALNELINDPQKRNRFGAASKEFLESNFNLDQIINEYRKAYEGKFEELKQP